MTYADQISQLVVTKPPKRVAKRQQGEDLQRPGVARWQTVRGDTGVPVRRFVRAPAVQAWLSLWAAKTLTLYGQVTLSVMTVQHVVTGRRKIADQQISYSLA